MQASDQPTQPQPPRSLNPTERARRFTLEKIVEESLAAFMKCGAALLEIHDDKLFDEGFTSFEDYCRERWHISARRARNFIKLKVVGVRAEHRATQGAPTAEKAPSDSEIIKQAERRVDAVIQFVERRSASGKRDQEGGIG